MKNLLFTLLLSAGILVSCNSPEKKISTDVVKNPNSAAVNANGDELPVIEFEETTHDFGKIIQGEKVSYTFKFKNVGKADLLISKVSTSCGCTATDYPKDPVKPGKSGKIEVTFDSHNKKGFQNKTATVLANTEPNYTTLYIKTTVEVPEQK
ncbi:MAG TPA: DUF1573 domain-containing protein [Bacteroidales bacterium]